MNGKWVDVDVYGIPSAGTGLHLTEKVRAVNAAGEVPAGR